MKTNMEPYIIGVDMSVGYDETSYAVFRLLMGKLTLIYCKRVPNDQKIYLKKD